VCKWRTGRINFETKEYGVTGERKPSLLYVVCFNANAKEIINEFIDRFG
jgi:hypothetical protein